MSTPVKAKVKEVGKMVYSSTCQECKDKCLKGIQYLEKMKNKGSGNGVSCRKVGK